MILYCPEGTAWWLFLSGLSYFFDIRLFPGRPQFFLALLERDFILSSFSLRDSGNLSVSRGRSRGAPEG